MCHTKLAINGFKTIQFNKSDEWCSFSFHIMRVKRFQWLEPNRQLCLNYKQRKDEELSWPATCSIKWSWGSGAPIYAQHCRGKLFSLWHHLWCLVKKGFSTEKVRFWNNNFSKPWCIHWYLELDYFFLLVLALFSWQDCILLRKWF